MLSIDRHKKRILFLVSGNGGLLQTVINACEYGILNAEIIGVVTDKNCYALRRAEISGISTHFFDRKSIGDLEFQKSIYHTIHGYDPDIIIMTFDSLLDEKTVETFGNRIINVHPALLPAFKGLNGIDNTLNSGVRYGGATIHFIDKNMDEGCVIAQAVLPIPPNIAKEIYGIKIFKEMVKMLHQVVYWILSDDIQILKGRINIRNGDYSSYPICPSGNIVNIYTEDENLFTKILGGSLNSGSFNESRNNTI